MDETHNAGTNAPQPRRRGRRGRGGAGSPLATASAQDTPKKPAITPAKAAASQAAALAAEEQAWERTHLEQVMFRLAREHAEAAARSAAARPPDREGERTHSLLAVLMAYFAVEAFINMVGQDRLGARFRHYDRMSPEGKWLEVTRLVSKSGRTFDEDGKELSALSTLRSWRNTLTHYKGRYEGTQAGGETQVDALLSAENAKQAVETATILYRAFYELDRRSAPRQFVWLDDRAPARPAPPSQPSPRRPAPSHHAGAPSSPPSTAPGTVDQAAVSTGRRRRRGGRRHAKRGGAVQAPQP